MAYNNIFDSHAHYDDGRFDEDRDAILTALPGKGVCGVVNCGTDVKSSVFSKDLAEKYGFIRFAAAIHPHEAAKIDESDYDSVIELAAHEKCVAIGETGLDYHYDFTPRDVQIRVFERHLQIAAELGLPVIIHDREAHSDVLEIIKKYRTKGVRLKGVLHCFSGGAELAKETAELGMYIGFGGAVTFKNAKKPLEAAAAVPLDRLLLETDAPYMSPEPFRGKRCGSDMIKYTAEKIAEIKKIETQELLAITKDNAAALFGMIT
ncbi:MAG: TatD family hydrolase [Oscillospiraceae bacterium]|nr:TatD family hydrolase [Oscillospiraceae bacterium]